MDGSLPHLPLIFLLFSLPASAANPASSPSWLRLIEPLPCSASLTEELEGLRASGEVLRAPGGIDGRPVYRIATDSLGVWVTLELEPEDGGVRIFHTRPGRTSVLTIDASCRVRRRVLSARPFAGGGTLPAFRDRDLEAHLAEHPNLLVYSWSPHMPLSVEGYFEAARAARRSGFGFVAVVDPAAESSFVDRAAARAGIPPQARRPLAAIELLFRDLAVHAPAVLAFVRGRPAAPLPGYRSEGAYLRYLRELLAAAEPETS